MKNKIWVHFKIEQAKRIVHNVILFKLIFKLVDYWYKLFHFSEILLVVLQEIQNWS